MLGVVGLSNPTLMLPHHHLRLANISDELSSFADSFSFSCPLCTHAPALQLKNYSRNNTEWLHSEQRHLQVRPVQQLVELVARRRPRRRARPRGPRLRRPP